MSNSMRRSFTASTATPPAPSFVRSLVLMLHGLSLKVYAEGVSTKAEAAAAWQAGVDGQTGAWASTLRADLVG